jgi:ABC-type antimicrobial peptide transport system permease subunit
MRNPERRAAFFGNQFVDLSAFEASLPVTIDSRVYVEPATSRSWQNGDIDTILKLMYALLGLAVLIALLGIANTVVLSIHERRCPPTRPTGPPAWTSSRP